MDILDRKVSWKKGSLYHQRTSWSYIVSYSGLFVEVFDVSGKSIGEALTDGKFDDKHLFQTVRNFIDAKTDIHNGS